MIWSVGLRLMVWVVLLDMVGRGGDLVGLGRHGDLVSGVV